MACAWPETVRDTPCPHLHPPPPPLTEPLHGSLRNTHPGPLMYKDPSIATPGSTNTQPHCHVQPALGSQVTSLSVLLQLGQGPLPPQASIQPISSSQELGARPRACWAGQVTGDGVGWGPRRVPGQPEAPTRLREQAMVWAVRMRRSQGRERRGCSRQKTPNAPRAGCEIQRAQGLPGIPGREL